MADDQVVIRAALRDELSRPLEGLQRQLAAVRSQVDKLDRRAGKASRGGTLQFGSGVATMDRVARRAVGSLARLTKIGLGGATLAAGGAAVAIYRVGGAYESALNTIRAVARPTAAQLDAVRAKARALGQDTTLFAVSAADAADVMVELAKGGLSISEAMDAAKGSLQLAGAAQISGADAAQIQVNALNQFRLSADKAGYVADVLANTANAASGEVTDMATALKYVGPIAGGLGQSLGETSAAIGLLANNGILADTAGTSLRTMLTSLSKPTKKQRKGLQGLGIDAYDAAGKFKGFRYVIGQLSEAQGRLNDQQFTAAAAAAFGREPLAAIVALSQEGTVGFDAMAKAVEHQGGAAEVSAAKTKGLHGAVEGLKSQLETVAIDLYTRAAPGLEHIVRQLAEDIPGAADKALSKLDGLALAIPGIIGQLRSGNDSGAAFSLATVFGGDPKAWEDGIATARDVVADLGTVLSDVLWPAMRDVGSQASLLLAPIGGLTGALSLMADHTTTSRIVLELLVGALVAYRLAVATAAAWTGIHTAATGLNTAAFALSNTTVGIWLGLKALELLAWLRSTAATALATASLGAYFVWQGIVRGATIAWTAVQWLLNAALTANPIGIVVVAIAALVAGAILAYKKVGWFRTAVDATWAALKTAWTWLVNAGKAVADLVVKFNPTLIVLRTFRDHWDDIKQVIQAVIDKFMAVIDVARRAKDAVAGGLAKLNPFGDTTTPRGHGGGLASTMAGHAAADAAAPGRRQVTSSLRTFDLGSSNSDHARGRAVDVVGSGLGAYGSAVRAMGGYAAFHGQGGGRHLHAVFPSGGRPKKRPGVRTSVTIHPGPHGDTSTPRRPGPGPGSGGVLVAPGAVQIVVQGNASDVDLARLKATVRAAVTEVLRDNEERS